MTDAHIALEKTDAANVQKMKGKQKGLGAGDDASDTVLGLRDLYCEIVRREHKIYQSGGRIIRRTGLSKDQNGNPVIDIKPYKTVEAFVELRQDEKDLLQEKANNVASMCVPDSQFSFR
jgi:hypothetical protein